MVRKTMTLVVQYHDNVVEKVLDAIRWEDRRDALVVYYRRRFMRNAGKRLSNHNHDGVDRAKKKVNRNPDRDHPPHGQRNFLF
jgi:hypothetical protein